MRNLKETIPIFKLNAKLNTVFFFFQNNFSENACQSLKETENTERGD